MLFFSSACRSVSSDEEWVLSSRERSGLTKQREGKQVLIGGAARSYWQQQPRVFSARPALITDVPPSHSWPEPIALKGGLILRNDCWRKESCMQ